MLPGRDSNEKGKHRDTGRKCREAFILELQILEMFTPNFIAAMTRLLK